MAGLNSLAVGGGVTDPVAGRHATGGLLAVQGPTALDIRTGVLIGPGTTALITGTADTGQMTVQIGVHHSVGSRGTANGPYLGPTLNAATKVNIAAAPGSGSRIDVVYDKQQDGNSGVPTPDVTTGPLYGVLQGTVSTGTPAKPDLTTIVGATELGTVTVAAGAASTNDSHVTITQTARQTVARGARIPLRNQAEQDALTAFPGLEVYRLDTGQVQLCTSTGPTTWAVLFDPARPPRASRPYSAGPYTGAAVNATATTLATVAIPDPGFPYQLLIDATQDVLVSPGSTWNFTARLDTASGTLIRPVGIATSTTYVATRIVGGVSGVLAGAHTVLFNAEKLSGAPGDGYQPNPTANVQSYRVLQVPA